MKKLALTLFSSLIYIIVSSQTRIRTDDAVNFVGQKVTLCDSVYSIKVLPHLTFVNLGGDYPKQKLTLVFYKRDLFLMDIDPSKIYNGRKICVTGKLITYEHKVQIIIKAAKQISYD